MKILVTAPFSEPDLKQLETFGDVVYRPWKANGREHTPEQLVDLLKASQANALIVEHDPVNARVLDEVKLEFIGVCRGTPSNVDVAAAAERGISVYTTPARNAQAVAEYVIGELIAMLRKFRQSKSWLLERNWTTSSQESYLQFRGSELCGKTVGLVGFGGVGQKIAGILKHFSCRIQYYDPFLQASPDPDYSAVELEKLFETSDIVSIHLPVTSDTIGMIDRRLFGLMKPDALFVNSARAAVVDRDALYEALKERKIGGAVVDVFYSEPPDERDYELIELPNVSATPHIAGNTLEVDKYHAQILLKALHQRKLQPEAVKGE
ncbi:MULTISPECIES: NAD(P)-dependent oxidoreductase [Cohnella]|uniref:NAD(P)-dependent oxidoreductase n=1 Tax=Cohnella TaxID=329857 RepID=UPI0009BC4BC4|nr:MULTISPECIES: NAD(P)-dependent oxidoreductase [Cohnella]MBN2982448.1 hydroxyacid dehydrogenase [Cohnella algarum]